MRQAHPVRCITIQSFLSATLVGQFIQAWINVG